MTEGAVDSDKQTARNFMQKSVFHVLILCLNIAPFTKPIGHFICFILI